MQKLNLKNGLLLLILPILGLALVACQPADQTPGQPGDSMEQPSFPAQPDEVPQPPAP